MKEILGAWVGLIEDSATLVNALEGGYDGVINALGDAADGALQNLVPAYAVAVAACARVSVPGFDCDHERRSLRNDALKEIVEALGLNPVIRTMLKGYNAVPEILRSNLKASAQFATDVVSFVEEPSVTALVDVGVAGLNQIISLYAPFLDVEIETPKFVEDAAKWVSTFGSDAAEAVAQVLSKYGQVLGSIGMDIIENGVEGIKNMIAFVDKIQDLGGDTNIGVLLLAAGGSFVAGPIGVVIAFGDDVVDAIGDTVSSVSSFGEDVQDFFGW